MRRIFTRAFFAFAGLLLVASCRTGEAPTRETGAPAPVDAAPEAPAAPDAAADAGLPPLGGAAWIERIELQGGGAALVSVPLGATEPRPIMVAVHGAGDRPDWACGGWRGVTRAYPFIVCPEGTPTADDRFYWSSTAELSAKIERAIVGTRRRFGAYVAEGPMLYAGFSAGAIYGAALVRDQAARFPVVMMSEGGYAELAQRGFAESFHKNGGRRILLGCSTGQGCVGRFSEAQRFFERAGVDARVNDAGVVGHNLNAEVVRSLRRDWTWLVRGEESWSGYAATTTVPRPKVDDDRAPVEVIEEEVTDDLPAFYSRGKKGAKQKIVFLTGACTHPQGYMQAFQFAAHAVGPMLGPQGDVSCGGPYRRWSMDLGATNARIEAGFEAAGESGSLADVVLVGYSQGALLAERLAEKYPERYSRVVLIASPSQPSPARLRRLEAAAMVAGDAEVSRMKTGAELLDAAGVPTTYLAMPGAPHGQLKDAEGVLSTALEWVVTRGRSHATSD
jgi:predicted esterase